MGLGGVEGAEWRTGYEMINMAFSKMANARFKLASRCHEKEKSRVFLFIYFSLLRPWFYTTRFLVLFLSYDTGGMVLLFRVENR